jgi:hypothetical protein
MSRTSVNWEIERKIMNEETIKLIRELAAKFGTTSEHLWGVMLKQAPLDALCDLLGFIIWIAVAFMVGKWFSRQDDWDETGRAVGMVLPWAACGIGVIALCCSLSSIVSGFFNPEYWALHHFIK